MKHLLFNFTYTQFQRGLCLILISTLLAPSTVFATARGPAPVPTPASTVTNPAAVKTVGNCKQACQLYKSSNAEQELTNACGIAPGPEQSPLPIENNGRTYRSYNDCKKSIYGAGEQFDKAARWGVFGQHCDAIELMETGRDMDLYGAAPYTASAVVCTAACVASYSKAVPWLAAYAQSLETACTLVGLAASAADIYGEIQVSQKGDHSSSTWNDWWQRKEGYAATAIGGVGTGAAAGAKVLSPNKAQLGGKNAMQAAGDQAATASKEAKAAADAGTDAASDAAKALKAKDDAANKLANLKADKAAGKLGANADDLIDAAETAAKAADDALDAAMKGVDQAADAVEGASKATKAAKQAGSKAKAQRALVCASAALFLASAAMKWANYATNGDLANQECEKLKRMEGIGTANIILPDPGPSSGSFTAGTASFNNALKAAGGSTTGFETDYLSHVNDDATSFPEAAVTPVVMTAAATTLLDSMPNKGQIPARLKDLGTSMSDITKRLATGTSPGDLIAATLPGMPNDMATVIKDLNSLAKEGALSIKGDTPSAMYASGGGGGGAQTSAASSDPFAMMKKGGSGAVPMGAKEIGFEKTAKKIDVLPSDGDVWHASFGGSIFQIISIKLNHSTDKYENLEWAHPLNRALNGLPPLKEKPAGAKK